VLGALTRPLSPSGTIPRVTVRGAGAENFIPFRRADLVAFCAGEGRLADGDAVRFRTLARLVEALFHHEFHERLERLKAAFAPFDPDADTRAVPGASGGPAGVAELVRGLEEVLEHANYEEVSKADLDVALEERSLIPFDIRVDFDDFADMLLFKRGTKTTTVEKKTGIWPFRRTRSIAVESFDRLVMLLRYRDAEFFRARGSDPGDLPFEPGKLYLQLFKDIPRADLEVLFPNVRVGMTRKHKALFFVPAFGAGIPVLIKVGVSLTALFTAIAIFLGLEEGGDAAALAGATAGLTALAALGGYLFRQYAKYKGTITRFLKGMTEQLFFKNIDSNAGVLRTLVDEAEEEEGKEALLAYYHLLAGGPATATELDRRIEAWFAERLDARLDFEIEDALEKLERLELVARDGDAFRAVPVAEAVRRADATWDALYAAEEDAGRTRPDAGG